MQFWLKICAKGANNLKILRPGAEHRVLFGTRSAHEARGSGCCVLAPGVESLRVTNAEKKVARSRGEHVARTKTLNPKSQTLWPSKHTMSVDEVQHRPARCPKKNLQPFKPFNPFVRYLVDGRVPDSRHVVHVCVDQLDPPLLDALPHLVHGSVPRIFGALLFKGRTGGGPHGRLTV